MTHPIYPHQKEKNAPGKYLGFLVLLLFVFLFGWNVGINRNLSEGHLSTANIMRNPYGQDETVDMAVFWEAWSLLNGNYVDPQDLNTQKMVYGAIKGMVEAVGDPYTVFMTPKESKEFQESVNGKFEGIGVEITLKDNFLTVVSPLKNSPAKRAGLQPGDIITHIDEQSAEDLSLEEAATLIRGPAGSSVTLSVFREGAKLMEITIERRDIKVNGVEWSMLEGTNIALLEVNRFNEETMKEFNAAINDILNQQARGLVLDLRFNSGGLLDASTAMAEAFLEGKNKKLVTIKKRDSKDDEVIYARGQGRLARLPMVVLINPGTASASEIVAGALQDHKRAVIVGETSFGKGTVQEVENLMGGAKIRVTIAKWFTPNDNNLSETGIVPDIEVPMTLEDYEANQDPQLEKALETLEEKMRL